MALHNKKYKQAILYLCSKLGKEVRGKKKLVKLLYYADFDFFEKYQKSITGDIYKSLPMGPFPEKIEEITKQMISDKSLMIKKIKERQGYNATEVYQCVKKPVVSALDQNEKKMLDRVVKKYGCLTGKQLEDLTHAEAPYIGTELSQEIPYELSFYRGTDFSDL